MKKFLVILASTLLLLFLYSCSTTKTVELEEVEHPKTAYIPDDGSTPVTGEQPAANPTRTITFTRLGEKVHVKTGETVNFVYEGIDVTGTFLMYESTDDGYTLQLAKLNEPLEVEFSRLCQTYIVASPQSTSVKLNTDVKYEQIIWTPRTDGTWEVRVGTTNRGCKSEALDRLYKLRNKEYEQKVKSTKMKNQ